MAMNTSIAPIVMIAGLCFMRAFAWEASAVPLRALRFSWQ
jgi:hypothetical protein